MSKNKTLRVFLWTLPYFHPGQVVVVFFSPCVFFFDAISLKHVKECRNVLHMPFMGDIYSKWKFPDQCRSDSGLILNCQRVCMCVGGRRCVKWDRYFWVCCSETETSPTSFCDSRTPNPSDLCFGDQHTAARTPFYSFHLFNLIHFNFHRTLHCASDPSFWSSWVCFNKHFGHCANANIFKKIERM